MVTVLTYFRLSIAVGYTGAYPTLSRDTPPISLISVTPILSIILHIILMTAFQVIAWLLVLSQPWWVWQEINYTAKDTHVLCDFFP